MLHGHPLEPGATIQVRGEEAQHAARVKRLAEGDSIEILNGSGGVGAARITRIAKTAGEWTIEVSIDAVEQREPARPRVEVWSSAPKGPRLEDMIDGLSQAGCAMWRPLLCERTVVDPREGKLSRLGRVAQESAKQCARAWVMEIGEAITFQAATATPPGTRVLIADAVGASIGGALRPPMERVVLLVGPEGGFSERELTHALGLTRVCLGPHTMRIETAAVVGAAMLVASIHEAPKG